VLKKHLESSEKQQRRAHEIILENCSD